MTYQSSPDLSAALERVRLARRLLEIQLQELDRAKGPAGGLARWVARNDDAPPLAPWPADRLAPLAPPPGRRGAEWQTRQTNFALSSTWQIVATGNLGRRTLVFAGSTANAITLSFSPLVAMAVGGLVIWPNAPPLIINEDQWGTLVRREWWAMANVLNTGLSAFEEWKV